MAVDDNKLPVRIHRAPDVPAPFQGTGTKYRCVSLQDPPKAVMNASVPDCLVTNYEKLITSIELTDPDDRHVVAAAIVVHAEAIVIFNTKDFPPAVLQPYGIEVQHPDEFLMNQLQLQKMPALSAVKKMRVRWTNPERPALALIAAFKKRSLLLTADLLREAVDLI